MQSLNIDLRFIRTAFSDLKDIKQETKLYLIDHIGEILTNIPTNLQEALNLKTTDKIEDLPISTLYSELERLCQILNQHGFNTSPEHGEAGISSLLTDNTSQVDAALAKLPKEKRTILEGLLQMKAFQLSCANLSADEALIQYQTTKVIQYIQKQVNVYNEDREQDYKNKILNTQSTTASGIRSNCLYHSTSLYLHQMLVSATEDERNRILSPFIKYFNQRHQTQLSVQNFLSWIDTVSNHKPHPSFIEAVYAPTLRSLVHQYHIQHHLPHAERQGSENAYAIMFLSNAVHTPIRIEKQDGVTRTSEVIQPQTLMLLFPDSSLVKSSMFQQPSKDCVKLQNNYRANHYDPLLNQAYETNHTTHTKEFCRTYDSQCGSHVDPMIRITQESITMWENNTYSTKKSLPKVKPRNKLVLHWDNMLLDLMLLISIIGIIPLILTKTQNCPYISYQKINHKTPSAS
ncbi:hypothetical protein OAT84_03405 [Gammaproteobacteria bacterium]|nr:hypothetical protein [Gammaproteobacteria bacterium]